MDEISDLSLHHHVHHHPTFDEDEHEQNATAGDLRFVKRLLRSAMSGPVSASMRAQGLTYKLNFGVDLPRLFTIADEVRAEITDLTSLAVALWKEDIRECKILASILMPTNAFDEELAEVWIEQLRFAEEAQVLAMNLLARVPYASDLAFRLISREKTLDRLTGWLLMGRLFAQGKSLSQRDADEMLDHLVADLTDTTNDLQLRQTALNALNRYMDLGEAEEARGERILAKFSVG